MSIIITVTILVQFLHNVVLYTAHRMQAYSTTVVWLLCWQVVQVFVPSWLGFPQADREPARQFALSYPGVPWYTMPIDDQVKWVSQQTNNTSK